ncbi:TIR domain-containing protein [Pseudoscourfieldia marina]
MMEEVKVVPLPPSPSLGVGDSTLLQSSTSESSLLSTLDTQHFKEAYRANHRSPLYSVGHAFVVFLNVTCCALLIVACWIKSRHFLKANFPEAAYWQDIGVIIIFLYAVVITTTAVYQLAENPPTLKILASKEAIRKRADNYGLTYSACFVCWTVTILSTSFVSVAYFRSNTELEGYKPGLRGADAAILAGYTFVICFVLAVVFFFLRKLRFELMRMYGPELRTWVTGKFLPWIAIAFLAQAYLVARFFFHMEAMQSYHTMSWGSMSTVSYGTQLLCGHIAGNVALFTFLSAVGLELFPKSGDEQVAGDNTKQERKHSIVLLLYCVATVQAIFVASFIEANVQLIYAKNALLVYGMVYLFVICGALCASALMEGRKSKGHYNQYLWQGGKEFHFFISHAQANGQDQVHAITRDLEMRGIKVWRDMDQAQITWAGMKKGVEKSLVFMLFLTKGAIARTWVQMEVLHAISLKKPIILVNETDKRHGGDADFYALFNAEEHLNHLNIVSKAEILKVANFLKCLMSIESISYKRRNWEANSMHDKILEDLEGVSKGQMVREELERKSAEAEELLNEIIEREGLAS